jgi:glycosyltransferase involved in cell wall biosynthesis
MELATPVVSIIIPNYNHEKYLVERLESIFNQSFTDYEVILLDDCSTDTSRNILSKYTAKSNLHLVYSNYSCSTRFQ